MFMSINWQQIIGTFVATVGGGGVILAAAAWLTKTLVSNRLALDVEKFKIEMKAKADGEIERVKALLMRATRVHARQVDVLAKLYRHFSAAQAYLQRMASTTRLEGEAPMEEYRRLCEDAIAAARDTFLDGRLMVPSDLAQQCDRFFVSLFQGELHLAFAQHPVVEDGLQRARFWDEAQKTAFEELPTILSRIEKAAREVIHGETAS